MLHTQFRVPSSSLKPFVRFYTEREVQITGAVVTHPAPARTCPMLGFYFRDFMTVKDNGQQLLRTSPKTVLVGLQTYQRIEMHLTGHLQCFYIMFRPEGFHRLFSIPMDQMTDQDYDARSVLGRFISNLEDRLGECNSFSERACLVEHALMNRVPQAHALDGVYFAAKQILETSGQASISTLTHQSGLSLRQFERRFRKQIGMRPKLFTRIARFESALERKARLQTASWTEIALDFGYFDQMHMVHDFANFTGKTPGESLAQLERLFVEPLRDASRDRARALAENNSQLLL
jgi:methylphosphotriester-DNA--protein-cysteine methyltransferase